MRYTRKKSKCSTCPLCTSRRVAGEGPENPKIVLVGEAPGRSEALEGRPFVGMAGKFLNVWLAQSGIARHQCYVMNVLGCKPPDTRRKANDLLSCDAQTAMQCCSDGFWEELTYVTAQCKTIAVLGDTALKVFFPDSDGILQTRGSVYDYSGHGLKLVVIPTFHPSYLGYNQHNPQTFAVWAADGAKIKRISDGGREVYPKKQYQITNNPDVLGLFPHGSPLAVDIETTNKGSGGFDQSTADIICTGLANNTYNAACVPFLSQYGVDVLGDNLQSTKDKLSHLLTTHPLLFQNAAFDTFVLENRGISVNFDNIMHDIMILHHVINPELPHNLGFIGSTCADVAYHKGTLKNKKVSTINLSDEELRTYNLDDCTILFRALPALLEDLKELGLEDLYYNERLKVIKPFVRMMLRGIRLDKKKLRAWVAKKQTILDELEIKLRSTGNLPAGFNFASAADLRLFLFASEESKFVTAKAKLRARELKIAELNKANKPKQALKAFKAKCHQDLIEQVKVSQTKPLYIPHGFKGRKTKTTKDQKTDEQNLMSYRNHLNKRLKTIAQLKNKNNTTFQTEIKQINSVLAWLSLYTEHTRIATLISNYSGLSSWIRRDGRIHCSINLIGTTTGRPAFSKPNLGTLPKKRDKSLRDAFVPEPGFEFVSADYKNAEFIALAYVTKDPMLIEVVEKNLNIHDINTKAVFGITPDDPDWDQKRAVMKTYQFGCIQYGGSDREIFEKILIECPDIKMTLSDFTAINTAYFKAHPIQRAWIDEQQRIALTERKTSTPMGFVRTLYGSDADIKKQAINTPIQGLIAHVINRAMIRIEDAMEKWGCKSQMILQIYDQLLFEAWPDEKTDLIKLIKTEMEKPVDIYGQMVSFPVDISCGFSFGELKEIK